MTTGWKLFAAAVFTLWAGASIALLGSIVVAVLL
jgi:hypothetical protein